MTRHRHAESIRSQHRSTRNFEALTIANRLAFEGAQAVLQRQSDQICDAVKGLAVLSQQLSTGGMIQKTSDEVVAVISTRIVDSFDDLCSGLWPKAAAKK